MGPKYYANQVDDEDNIYSGDDADAENDPNTPQRHRENPDLLICTADKGGGDDGSTLLEGVN